MCQSAGIGPGGAAGCQSASRFVECVASSRKQQVKQVVGRVCVVFCDSLRYLEAAGSGHLFEDRQRAADGLVVCFKAPLHLSCVCQDAFH